MSKIWFVTGSSRGLGRNRRNTRHLDELVAAHGDAVLPLALDVTDKAAVFDSVKRAKEHFGGLHIVVNNAAYGLFGAVEEMAEQQLRDQLETNLFGPLRVVQAALPHLREQGGGHIIQISSVGGLTVFPLGGGYVASKWALEGLSETLAQEVAAFGIKVTLVEPGSYATEGYAGAGGVRAEANPLYDGLRASFTEFAETLDVGDPAAAGRAILKIADADNPPLRVFFGTQGTRTVPQVYADRLKTWADWQDLSAEAHGLTPTTPAV